MTLTLVAPMTGWAGPLGELPDAAFAGGLVGDGVAVDPVEPALHAPCAGVVVGVHRARHAVTLRADNGAEILCHVGIETVGLNGEGFTALVSAGDRVQAGTPLLAFDLDVLAGRARSLASPILVIDTEAFRVSRRAGGARVAVGDWLMDVEATGTSAPIAAPAFETGAALSREIVLPPGHGIHARPAAAIVARAREFAADVELATASARVPATSAVGLMTLGAAGGDRLTLHARGRDAAEAIAALAALIEHELEHGPAEAGVAPLPATQQAGAGDGRRAGVTAVPGVAVGTIVRLDAIRREPPLTGEGIAAETASLDGAVAAVRAALIERAVDQPGPQGAIADAHLALLDDPRLHAAAAQAIAGGASAGAAWRAALAPDIAALRALADPRIAARADDLLDLEQQVIAATLGAGSAVATLPDDAILVAHDLLPSELMALDATRLTGIALVAGGPTSHVAIIAAAQAVPMVVALGAPALALPKGVRAILDGDAATLVEATSQEAERMAQARIGADRARRAAAQAAADVPCRMADGTRIEVFANLGSLADAGAAMAAGAEGCGLLRTELLFLDRDAPPDEEEQRALYAAIAARLGSRPLIVRTLDVGGDKPVRYLPIGPEENPALGLRGIRVGLSRPDLLDTQLRAILRASPGQCRILLPMIASVAELVEVRRRAEAAAQAAGVGEPVSLGVMIETPAAAIAADLLAPHADFFAIGTNDLAQYTLAMDRGNPAVAAEVDALHPAVLRMIAAAARAGTAEGRPVGVCGGLASDLAAAGILIGLGVTELSAVPGVIPELKAHVRSLTGAGCAALAAAALDQPSAAAVRAIAAGGAA